MTNPVPATTPDRVRGSRQAPSRRRRRLSLLILGGVTLALTGAPASQAAVTSFGSPLGVPATLDTANNLSYAGTDIPIPGKVVHVNHDGADTALWNARLASGAPTAPASGQLTAVKLEGCAQAAEGGPAPLTQIHFQDLVPTPGGGARVPNPGGSSQAFDIPICGVAGVSGTTITTYQPTNLCVRQGDYIDLNTEGGFDSTYYPSGVPYRVIGSVAGSVMNSFVRHNATGNGSQFSPSDTTNHDGFAANPDRELMLQGTLATGPDASVGCGGTRGPKAPVPGPPISIPNQTDG
ncbi:MAG TPA: hypothetical protein VGN69_00455, partial [Solirubrobacteraceae bacterium]|nr:hypothetical protein [Solirubrobacteraceae bacterium]